MLLITIFLEHRFKLDGYSDVIYTVFRLCCSDSNAPVMTSGVVARRGGHGLPCDNFLGALKSKGGAKIRNCQCEISYKICKVQLVNKFKVVVILAFL